MCRVFCLCLFKLTKMEFNNINEAINSQLEKFENCTFNFKIQFDPTNYKRFRSLDFKNCFFKFNVEISHIIQEDLDIKFINCKFHKDLEIHINIIRDLTLVWHLDNNDSNNCHILSKFGGNKLNISSNQFHGLCYISGLTQNTGSFSFSSNVFLREPRELYSNRKTNYSICKINYITFNNLSLHGNTLYMPFEFIANNLFFDDDYQGHTFKNNLFQKSNFSKTNFGNKVSFHDSKFFSTTLFTECQNATSTEIVFSSCEFKGFSLFDRSMFKKLEIKHTIFEKKASFEQIEIEYLKLHQVSFFQGAFFDEAEISTLNKKYISSLTFQQAKELRRTIRAIKQELQKSDNKIDYNRFRSYELFAYYRELKWCGNFKDKFILYATKWVTGFDHSWRQAFTFSLIAAFFFYSLFFVSEDYILPTGKNDWQSFITGYFRFLIVTDFYNPLSDGRNYIDSTNTIGWFIFILGKIVIAFGIYEMIQAFRKFKA